MLEPLRIAKKNLNDELALEVVEIPAGRFMMGSTSREVGAHPSEYPQHLVQVKGFLLGKYAVTQQEYSAVMGNIPDGCMPRGYRLPVVRVSWENALNFCVKLSKETGRKVRLPSEAMWEYACRAGTTTPFSFGVNVTRSQVNYRSDEEYYELLAKGAVLHKGRFGYLDKQPVDIDSFSPNRWGLYQMHGNVWEWCDDELHENYEGAPADGSAWIDVGCHKSRIARGGSCSSEVLSCRSASRNFFPNNSNFSTETLGFRVAVLPRDY